MATPIDPAALKKRLDDGTAILLDLRDAEEFAREHIPGARLVPAPVLDARDLAAEPGKAIVLACASGTRTDACLARLPREAAGEAYVLEGGLSAWKRAGLPVVRGAAPPISLARQTMIGAGLMVLLWLALGVFVSPWFLLMVAFVGVMLNVAGWTGFCPMTRLLARLPWNRPARA